VWKFLVNIRSDELLIMLPLFYRSDDHEEIRRIFPAAKFETIRDAGHWVHADKPNELLDIMKDFIQTVQTIEGTS